MDINKVSIKDCKTIFNANLLLGHNNLVNRHIHKIIESLSNRLNNLDMEIKNKHDIYYIDEYYITIFMDVAKKYYSERYKVSMEFDSIDSEESVVIDPDSSIDYGDNLAYGNIFQYYYPHDELPKSFIGFLDKNYMDNMKVLSKLDRFTLLSYVDLNNAEKDCNKYFYIDRSNIKSFIRPVNFRYVDDNVCMDGLDNEYKALIKESGKSPINGINGMFLKLHNKICLTSGVRINLSLGDVFSVKTSFIDKWNSLSMKKKIEGIVKNINECPIVKSFKNQDYKIFNGSIEGEDVSKGFMEIVKSAVGVLDNIDKSRLYDEDSLTIVGNKVILDSYDAHINNPDQDSNVLFRKNISIVLIKHIILDVDKLNLNERNVYLQELDIVIGKTYTGKDNNLYNNIETCYHPYSPYGEKMLGKKDVDFSSNYVEYKYICNKEHAKPLYIDNFGYIMQVNPISDPSLEDGLYLRHKENEDYIRLDDSLYGMYGIYSNRDFAKNHHKLLAKHVFNEDKLLDIELQEKRHQTELKKLEYKDKDIEHMNTKEILKELDKRTTEFESLQKDHNKLKSDYKDYKESHNTRVYDSVGSIGKMVSGVLGAICAIGVLYFKFRPSEGGNKIF